MQELLDKVGKLINADVPTRPSLFQLQHFMIGKEPTHQAKLKRIIEELRSRNRDVEAATDEIAECLDRRRLLELGHGKDVEDEPEVKEIKGRMLTRRLGAIDRQVFDLRQVVASKMEEIEFLVDAYDRLSREQTLLPWDHQDVQLEYWETKLKNEIGLRLRMKVPQDLETIKTVLSLPPSSRLKKEMMQLMGDSPLLSEKTDADK